MHSMKTRKIVAGFAAFAALAGPLAGTAAAKPIKGATPKSCTQNLPDGAVVEYTPGTTITIRSGSKTTKFRCESNGQWKQIALEVIKPPIEIAPPVNIGPGLPNA